jgi:hypothetical protein
MRVIAIPNPRFRPPEDVLAEVDVVLPSLAELMVSVVSGRS